MQTELNLPFQAHSETSRKAAAEAAKSKESQSARIYALLVIEGERGITGREVFKRTGIKEGTVSARLRDLELTGKVLKTSQERADIGQNTPSHVYVLTNHYKPWMGIAESRILIKPDDYRRACSIVHAFIYGDKENAHLAGEKFLKDINYRGEKEKAAV